MYFDPGSKNIVLGPEDLYDNRVADGWALALSDGAAVTLATRHGVESEVMEIPRACALAYLPAFMVALAVRQSQQQTAGNDEQTWGGWQASLKKKSKKW